MSALKYLGFRRMALFAAYRLGLRLGWYRFAAPDWEVSETDRQRLVSRACELLPMPGGGMRVDRDVQSELQREADRVIQGKVRLFGGYETDLVFDAEYPAVDWTVYEAGKAAIPGEDPKFAWEPGRFGWAFSLGRAYHLGRDERYAEAFWANAELFLDANPPYLGPQWVSAQEVALRLIALCWAISAFSGSEHSTPERQLRLLKAAAVHASRIPPSLVYARSQNNNHLLTEAAGLYTAGTLLSGQHPQAARWRMIGWEWFHRGLEAQIAADGSYIQNSTNYHRLMLQTALWMYALARREGDPFPRESSSRLAASTAWLANLVDAGSGCVPNLGPNDGAYILPLTGKPFIDFRPVVDAAQRAFCGGQSDLPVDEMEYWLGLTEGQRGVQPGADPRRVQGKLVSANSWAYLRAVHFRDRPGHADQLHLDLWWRGRNIAMDAGTYRYTAPVPWDNALTVASVHNTVTVDGLDQMKRVGRFLYLDWAQAEVTADETAGDGAWQKLTAEHDGYRQLGLSHRRSVTAFVSDRWLVEDDLLMGDRRGDTHTYRLHWLLPDWEWELEWKTDGVIFGLNSVEGKIQLAIRSKPLLARFMVVRAGEVVQTVSSKMEPFPDIVPTPSLAILGWYSPTYAVKKPALSLVAEVLGETGANFISEWRLPQDLNGTFALAKCI